MSADKIREKIIELELLRDQLTDEIQKARNTIERGLNHRRAIESSILAYKGALKKITSSNQPEP